MSDDFRFQSSEWTDGPHGGFRFVKAAAALAHTRRCILESLRTQVPYGLQRHPNLQTEGQASRFERTK